MTPRAAHVAELLERVVDLFGELTDEKVGAMHVGAHVLPIEDVLPGILEWHVLVLRPHMSEANHEPKDVLGELSPFWTGDLKLELKVFSSKLSSMSKSSSWSVIELFRMATS